MESEKILKACSRGDFKLLKAFLDDCNREQIESIRDKNQASCLHYASRNGCLNILEYLIIEKNVCPFLVSEVGATCLHDAAVKGRIDVIEWLLKNTSLSTSFKDSNGANIWHLSSKFDQIELIDWLIQYEGNKGAKAMTFNGATCHHFAASSNAFKSLRRLIQIVPNYVNCQMINGVTPIYLAIQENNIPIVKYLIKSGANINIRAEDGMNSIHVACQTGDLDMVRMLIEEYYANINEKDFNGATPLHYACVNGNSKLVAYLLNNKAEIRLDKYGNTPLHDTALGGHLECARLLIANKCDVSLRDSEGMSASDIAMANGFKQLGEEIRKFEVQKINSEKLELMKQKSLINRSLRKSPTSLINTVQSPLFSDMTQVPSSTPSSDLEKIEELNKINSKTYTKKQAFVQIVHNSRPNSMADLTQVSAIDELDKCIAEFENEKSDESRLSTKIFINNTTVYSDSNKTVNKLDSDFMSPDQNNNNITTISLHSSTSIVPPPAPPLPNWTSNNKENMVNKEPIKEKSPFGFLKPADRSRKQFNFMDELNSQLRKKNENSSSLSSNLAYLKTPKTVNSKFEQTLENIKKVTEYRVLRQTNEDSNMPEWKRQLLERKKSRQAQENNF
ncbi:unnamed protein product [Brachionus calyciflorus]|uniref:Uncharacterized protein n=1 Tax=Brachionus calyciflorus TaxID=104777 RepID=A0A813MG75_9BILA|nr:unnamed protein product [Brachionus calyciflorus]